jgi:hypothetical protein
MLAACYQQDITARCRVDLDHAPGSARDRRDDGGVEQLQWS